MDKKDIYYLAINISHNASVALMRNGVVVSAVLEERFSRKKNYVGYPKRSIDFCLQKEGITGAQLERIACTTTYNPGIIIKAKTSTQFSLRDYMDYYGEKYYGPKIRGEDVCDYLRWLDQDLKFNEDEQYFDFSYLTDEVLQDPDKDVELFGIETVRCLAAQLGVAEEKIEFLDHHTCHAYYAYFGSPFRGKDCIALTLDSWGDGRNQTVWKVSEDKFELLSESQQNDIARIYKIVTLILGMRPDEHEFKVMGLAPYAKEAYVARTMSVIENLLNNS